MSASPLLDLGGENQQMGVIETQIYNIFVGWPGRIKLEKLLSVLIM